MLSTMPLNHIYPEQKVQPNILQAYKTAAEQAQQLYNSSAILLIFSSDD